MTDKHKWTSAAGLAVCTVLFGLGLILALPVAILSAIVGGAAMGLTHVALWPLMRAKQYVGWGTAKLVAWQDQLFGVPVCICRPDRPGWYAHECPVHDPGGVNSRKRQVAYGAGLFHFRQYEPKSGSGNVPPYMH